MSVDVVQATLHGQAVHPKPEAKGQSGRNPRRDQQDAEEGQEREDPPNPLLNSLGQIIGKTINITA